MDDDLSPTSRAPMSAGGATTRPPRRPVLTERPVLTKRRVIDLMRVGRSSCRPLL